MSEGEMAGWHHQCNEHELGQTLGDGEGQGGLACCSPWGRKELDTSGPLNNNKRGLVTKKVNLSMLIRMKYDGIKGWKM